MYKISEKAINFITKAIKNWKVDIVTEQTLEEGTPPPKIFFRESRSCFNN